MKVRGLSAVLVLIAASVPASASRSAQPPRHVLMLHSYEREFAPHGRMAEIFQKELNRRSEQPINFFDVSLQPARSSRNPADWPTVEYLLSTFAGQRLDLIVSIGGPAAQFALRHRDRLFPEVPLLLASVDQQTVAGVSMPANTVAASVANDAPKVIETALALLPDTTSVYVVIGTSALEEFWRTEMSREFQRFRNRVSFRWLNGLSAAQMLKRSARLPPHSIVFYSIFSVDAKGAPQVGERMLSELHDVANAPIFGFHSGQLGSGIVGGPLLSIEQLGDSTTTAALRLLQGEPASDIRIPTQLPGSPVYDWRELRRWNIAESRLPAASVVHFRQPTTWQRYKWQITAGLSIALIEAGLVVALLTIHVKRRRAEHALRESEERFRLLADSAPAMVWMSGPDGERTDFNRGWLDFTGRTIEHEGSIDGWLQGVHAADVEHTVQACSQAFDRREHFRIEYRLRRRDGEHRWILDTGLPRFDASGAFVGYIGSCIDVTDLKLAKAALASLSHKLMQSQEGERSWIAKELHEELGQRLAGLTMRLHCLSRVSIDDSLRTRVGDLCAQFGDVGRDIQAISYRLYSYKLEYLGLAAAVGAMCQEAARQHTVAIDFSHDGVPHDLPREVALGLFHVLQQAIDNAVQHSGTRDIAVDLRGCPAPGSGCKTGDGIQLKVSDDGIGFDPEEAVGGDGLGLIHMRERLTLVNGELLVESRPGAGTTVIARVPIPTTGDALEPRLPLDGV
jgi:PAS domain S-box-containing protein